MTTKPARPTDWTTEPLPEHCVTIPLDRMFSADDMDRIHLGLIPEVMEDKWFIYWRDQALHFHRSWTGRCVYVVHFASEGGAWRMVRAEADPDADHRAEMVSYLIDALLLRRPADHYPGPDRGHASVLGQWSLLGRAMLGQHPDGRDVRDE